MSDVPIFGGSKWMGICYGPYHQEATKAFSSYTQADVAADMVFMKEHYSFIRTYAVSDANKWAAEEANNNGLQMALGAWIYPGNSAKTQSEIDLALSQANQYPDTVKIVCIGNEVDLASNGYTYSEVDAAFKYAVKKRASYPALADLPLTICMMGTGPTAPTWSPLMTLISNNNSAGNQHIFLTVYPWYGGAQAGNINAQMEWSYNNGISQAQTAGLNVVIAEMGWPSGGGDPRATWQNEVTNYSTSCSYITGTNQYNKSWLTFWFEMFDEPWKTPEGPQGPHFGIYSSGKHPVPKDQTDGPPALTACD